MFSISFSRRSENAEKFALPRELNHCHMDLRVNCYPVFVTIRGLKIDRRVSWIQRYASLEVLDSEPFALLYETPGGAPMLKVKQFSAPERHKGNHRGSSQTVLSVDGEHSESCKSFCGSGVDALLEDT